MAEKQFDLVSKTLEKQVEVQAILNQQKSSNTLPNRSNVVPSIQTSTQSALIPPTTAQSLPVDPRARDPRTARAPVSALNEASAVPSFYPPDSDEMQQMIERQIQMANEMAKQTARIPPTEDIDIRVPSSSHYETSPRDIYYEERRREAPPHRGRFGSNPPRGGPPKGRFKHGDEPNKRFPAKDDRNWNESSNDNPRTSPPSKPINQSPKDEQTRNTASTAPLSLREKRKDNQFESPLSSGRRF